MADTKLSALTELAAAPAVDDEVYIRDVSEVPTAESKRITIANVFTSPTLVTPALGTPASGVMTNVTGTAAGMTAGNVTTNANLTGVVTSTGNATAIANKALVIAKLADGTDGELITWDATGVIATVAVGTATHVLTSNGVGVAPTFQAAAAGASLTVGETVVFNTTLTASATWQDLDLSGTVGAKTTFCLFKVISDDATARRYAVRKNGDTADYYGGAFTSLSSTSARNLYHTVVGCFTDSSGVIEHITLTNATTITLTLMGYIN